MLARGWLAYPVTSMHSHLPPKSGCIIVIPRFALSRRRATALFRNPVCKAQRSVPGFSSTPTSACRRYATSPPSAVASPHRPPSSSDCASTSSAIIRRFPHHIVRHPSSDCANGAIHRHRRKPPKSGCRNVIPSVCLPRDALRHTQRAEPPFPGSPALRLNQLLFSYSITFCALPSTTTT